MKLVIKHIIGSSESYHILHICSNQFLAGKREKSEAVTNCVWQFM